MKIETKQQTRKIVAKTSFKFFVLTFFLSSVQFFLFYYFFVSTLNVNYFLKMDSSGICLNHWQKRPCSCCYFFMGHRQNKKINKETTAVIKTTLSNGQE